MEQFKSLTGNQKARMISFVCIVLLLVFSVIGYAGEYRNATAPIDYAENVNVDGSDFTAITNVFVFATNTVLQGITMAVSCIAMLIIALVLLVPWRLITIRKHSIVHELEVKTATKLMWIFVIVALVLGVIIAGISGIMYIAVLVIISAMLLYFLGVRGIRKAYDILRKES